MEKLVMTKQAIALHWLGGNKPARPTGVTCGIPWAKGALSPEEAIGLRTKAGKALPAQTWPLGYWPDGSIKWSALAAVLDGSEGEELFVEKSAPTAPAHPLQCIEQEEAILVRGELIQCEIPRSGSAIIKDLVRQGIPACSAAQLICQRERREFTKGKETRQRQRFVGELSKVTVEQAGPLRAVIKLEGTHRSVENDETFLPFVVRLYFYASLASIRLVHTFFYDGDATKDFLAGVGLRFLAPLSGALHNRHVWLAEADGEIWREPVRLAPLKVPDRPRSESNPMRLRQLRGEKLETAGGSEAMPVWQNYSLLQDSAEHYVVRKSCGPDFAAIEAKHGHRALGMLGIYDFQCGLAVGLRDFWQSYPSELTLHQAGAENSAAELTAWFWSPSVAAADLRHYSDKMFGATYEDYRCMEWEVGPCDPARSNPYGIARTSELTLWATPPAPEREELIRQANAIASPPLLVGQPEHYHDTGVFGVWSLVNHKTAATAKIENWLTQLLDFYLQEGEARSWYSLWHYGDIMHSYDKERHIWRYDEGGYAWANTECMPDIWLWYSFLRTGRADVFRLAEAMTRHTSEVDVYHFGPLAGLGSRHNVIHWGCGCKEARISMAGCRRFYYFLTGDERTGDILTEVCDSWPRETTQLQAAPWWANLCWNWVTAWERTQEPRYREKLLRGINDLLKQEPPLLSGLLFMFDPNTGALDFIENQTPYDYVMTLPFGAPEIWLEMATLLEHEGWRAALAKYGEFWSWLPDEREKVARNSSRGDVFSPRLIAYAARQLKNPALAQRVLALLLEHRPKLVPRPDSGCGKIEQEFLIGDGATNKAAQWSLNVIQSLELIPEALQAAGEKLLESEASAD